MLRLRLVLVLTTVIVFLVDGIYFVCFAQTRGTFSGVLRTDDLENPLKAAYVLVTNIDTHEMFSSGPTDSEGRFLIDGLPGGTYKVLVRSPVGIFEFDEEIRLLFPDRISEEEIAIPTARTPVVPTETAANESSSIRNVAIDRVDDKWLVTVVYSGGLSYSIKELREPQRLIFDFENAINIVQWKEKELADSFIIKVRISQYKYSPTKITRLVIETDGPSVCREEKKSDSEMRFWLSKP